MPSLNTGDVIAILTDVVEVFDQPRACECLPRAITDRASATLRQALTDLGVIAHYERQVTDGCTHPPS